jgi:hypothetical protein
MKIRLIILSIILAVLLVGCGESETDSKQAEVKVEEKNEHGISMSKVNGIKETIDALSKAKKSGDIDTYISYMHDWEEEDREDMMDYFDRKPTETINSIEVIYEKDNEALAIVEATVMTETYDTSSNYNQNYKDLIIYHYEEEVWAVGESYTMDVEYLNENGEVDNDYFHIHQEELIQSKIDEITSKKLLPSEFVQAEKDLIEIGEDTWERFFDIYMVNSVEDIETVTQDTFVNPDLYLPNFLAMSDTLIGMEYVEIDYTFHSGVITSKGDDTFTFEAYVNSKGVLENGDKETLDNGNFVVTMVKDVEGNWKFDNFYIKQ